MRFFFDMAENGIVDADEDGLELDTLSTAKSEAARTAADAAAEMIPKGQLRSLAIQVRGADGRVVHVAEVRFDARDTPY